VNALQDPYQMEAYLAHNTFLADINNERPAKNATYRANLASLEKLVLFRFKDDVTVVPRDSAWFGFYNGSQLLRMEETALYQVCVRACIA
jgi:palmitoyl-protein thioesterase